MTRWTRSLLLAPALAAACATSPDRQTLATLHAAEPDLAQVKVENSLDQAMVGYRKFLEEAPESSLTPEAMRRLADLELEKEYGILGDGQVQELPAPERTEVLAEPKASPRAARTAHHAESEQEFERRATAAALPAGQRSALDVPGGQRAVPHGPLEAIALYDQILAAYPNYPQIDQVLYQKARAFDELGRVDEAIAVIEQLIASHPGSRHQGEVQFRRGEYFFTRKKFLEAEKAYAAVTAMGASSEYYELALYKLGWAFYKQDLLEEALGEYVALLDYKVSTGYDFDQKSDEDTERRVADTFRVISLSFSSLGGPASIGEYFGAHGRRGYENRIYGHLGEFYLEKLRFQDAAASYQAFIDLNPLHEAAPHFSMRVIQIYEQGDFSKLVLDAKKRFAATYGLQSEYWRHFDIAKSPEVRSYLKSNLGDLAHHYHALYQSDELTAEKPANFAEAERWYRGYLDSFPREPETPGIHYRLGDLLLENRDFGHAALEYERTAYDYAEHADHELAAAAGYAAIYAHREHEKAAAGEAQRAVQRDAVASTLRFVERFPQHEHAAAVLGAAVDDLYEMKEFDRAIATGSRLIEAYPQADPAVRRSAWAVVAHASFETAAYPQAEQAYARVLEMTPDGDASRQGVIDNLAASIYKQGEQANTAQDYRTAADQFLRVAKAAPTSSIRPAAEYDAGAALMRLEDWDAAGNVLDEFRKAYPEHELQREATRQIAFVKREEGDLAGAAAEYERVAAESEDAELRREAQLEAGELYGKANAPERALAAYLTYVEQFPEPIEPAIETRFKIAGIYATAHDAAAYHGQLRQIVDIDATAGGQRTDRVRYLAAQSAFVLAQELYRAFGAVSLSQPFERSLVEKQTRMNAALARFAALVDYEVAEVTAGATFFMAEIYGDFSRSLVESERPGDLSDAERADYDATLEGEAFPFEEKAIAVHEKNLELLGSGVCNAWVEKSLARLAALSPGRYAKPELSSGPIAAIDRYAYRAPVARVAPAAPAPAPAQVAEPAQPVEPVEPAAPAALDEVGL